MLELVACYNEEAKIFCEKLYVATSKHDRVRCADKMLLTMLLADVELFHRLNGRWIRWKTLNSEVAVLFDMMLLNIYFCVTIPIMDWKGFIENELHIHRWKSILGSMC